MKTTSKIYTILALVLMASAISFAAPLAASGSNTGTYTATVYCVPTISIATNTYYLGAFMPATATQTITANTSKVLDWKINGDQALTYNIAVTGAGDYRNNTAATINAQAPNTTTTLQGTWDYQCGDGDHDGGLNATQYKSAETSTQDDISCGGVGLHVKFTPVSISTDSPTSTSTETFNLSVTVTAQM